MLRATLTLSAFLGLALLPACKRGAKKIEDSGTPAVEGFAETWYDGLAEVNRYRLTQNRYGAAREGEAVLIFVTEPFLVHGQVKADDPEDPHAIPVLKLNSTRSFLTGVYPYSAMTSAFSPVGVELRPLPLKVTTSIQEWCGHTFSQLNLEGRNYRSEVHSYFEVEGDAQRYLPAALPEEGLFARIRLGPELLPTGDREIIPSQLYSRFHKFVPRPCPAALALQSVEKSEFSAKPHRLYRVQYREIDRTLTIAFDPAPPHRILGWSESQKDTSQPATVALLAHTERLPYWEKNKPGDEALREKMGFSR